VRRGFVGGIRAGVFICWNVAEEYRGTRWMRWAWLALTMDAGLSNFKEKVTCLTSENANLE
jgi:hypothetical protein